MKKLIITTILSLTATKVFAWGAWNGTLKCTSKNSSFEVGYIVSQADGFFFDGEAKIIIGDQSIPASVTKSNVNGSYEGATRFTLKSLDSKRKIGFMSKVGAASLEINDKVTVEIFNEKGVSIAVEEAQCTRGV